MAYTRTSAYGGGGGSAFQDDLTEVCRLVAINLRSGARIDMIQAVWERPDGSRFEGGAHGGGGGDFHRIDLQPGERIVRVDLRSGDEVDQLTFTTDKGNSYGPFGGGGGSPHTLSNLEAVTGFVGRSGSRLDQIGFWIPAKCP